MKQLFKKEQVLTVPNLLTLIRLLLIPVIVWLYCVVENHYAAAAVIALSGLTDVVDGRIARRFNQISDLGKIIDPIADKLTQAAMMVCLGSKYRRMVPLFILFAVKEIIMSISGIAVINKEGKVNSARWYGKVNTVVLYAVMIVLFLFPGIPDQAANVMITVCMITVIWSMVMYLSIYWRVLRVKEAKEK